jgi:hypothetical protein
VSAAGKLSRLIFEITEAASRITMKVVITTMTSIVTSSQFPAS